MPHVKQFLLQIFVCHDIGLLFFTVRRDEIGSFLCSLLNEGNMLELILCCTKVCWLVSLVQPSMFTFYHCCLLKNCAYFYVPEPQSDYVARVVGESGLI